MSELKKAIEETLDLGVEFARDNLNLTGFAGKKRKTNNTDKLSKGLGWELTETDNGFTAEYTTAEEYGIFIEKGVNGWKKSQGSQFKFKKKNLKKGVMEEYIRTSKMRLRKVYVNKYGQKVSKFVPKTKANIKAAAFTMGRAIARDGIVRTDFMKVGNDKAFEQNKDKLEDAQAVDMAFELGGRLAKIGFTVK